MTDEQTPDEDVVTTDATDDDVTTNDTPDEPDTFPRSYVEKLRDENAKFRQRAQRADELAQGLHRSRVEATGRLADPSDLEFSDEHLEDAEKLTAAIDELLTRKPHLAARKPFGNIGQGTVSHNTSTVDLAGLLRAGAN
ncbi:hypothetical protein BG28_06630 [Nesterenkonia sp. AN1]|nr:hypothetical protein BG28_06630 [Nesterenkonia sp. AN1]